MGSHQEEKKGEHLGRGNSLSKDSRAGRSKRQGRVCVFRGGLVA